ncbi:MAG: NADH-quinone oxidoreductase subunit L [Gemmatimonadota bacterium]|nr:NADH-quinone oxidoreductase subunit L [Gemmatimonadota bacterium]
MASPLMLLQESHAAFEPVLPALILLLPLAGAVVNGAGAFLWRENRTIPSVVGPAAVLGAFLVVAANFLAMSAAGAHDAVVVPLWTWMSAGGLDVGVDLQFDRLSILMMLVVTGVSSVIHVYSVGYMGRDPGYSRYFAYLNLFVFFMLVLVMGANFALTFVGWEGVGLCSYLLIGFWYENREFASAGKKAFVVNRIGDFGFLVAMFLIYAHFGTLDYGTVFAAAPAVLAYGGIVVTAITLFLFLGCTGKSAQIPLYVWLPDAMAGPTPVSALIHAATMVTAGVYLVARAGVLFALSPVSQAVVAAVGAGTAIFAATIATQQVDIKKVLAYSTVSQLGYMFLAVGIGAYTAGIFHLMTHAFFKALLFLGSGAVIHAMHHALHETHRDDDPNDMRNHGGLKRFMPITWATMWIGTLAISGVVPFAGFFSKDEIIWYTGAYGYGVLWGVALLAALLTAGYMTRLMVLTFHGENRTGEDARPHLHEVPPVMWVPLAILAALSLVGGWVNIPDALPVLPGVHALHDWLHPVFEPAIAVLEGHGLHEAHASPVGGGEALWAGISTVAALVVIFLTFRALVRRRYVPAAEAAEPAGLAGVLYHKWYVDELYDRVVIRPLLALWRGCWKIVDAGLIDGTVNGLAAGSRAVGWVGSLFQTGRVATYMFYFVTGVLVILATFLL